MTFRKVYGRIEVRAAVFRRGITISGVEIAFVSHAFEVGFELELFGGGPVNTIRVKSVCQVDDVTGGQVAAPLRCDRHNEKQDEQKLQTLHAECSLRLGFCYLQVNNKSSQGS